MLSLHSLSRLIVLIVTGSSLYLSGFSAQNSAYRPKPPRVVHLNWVPINISLKLHRYFTLNLDAQLRFVGFTQQQTHNFRMGPEVVLDKHFSFIPAGYLFAYSSGLFGKPQWLHENEHRLYQQLVYKVDVSRVNLQMRVRLEHRWFEERTQIEKGNNPLEGYSFENRFRYRLSASVPLNKPKIEKGAFFVSVWDEIFVSWGKGIVTPLPDQNRLSTDFGYRYAQWGEVLVGYLYIVNLDNGYLKEVDHSPRLTFNFTIDAMRKPKNKGIPVAE